MLKMILMISIPLFTSSWQEKPALLETKVTMKIYASEILESVILRINADTGANIRYSTLMLLPFKAKAREYQNISVREILDDQLTGTPLKYKLLKKVLTIYNAQTGDHSTNLLSPKKN
jgi:hypothetical protein